MDQERFDRITRTLGSGQSRRSLLKGLAAGVLGIGAGGALGTSQAAPGPSCCAYLCPDPDGGGGSVFFFTRQRRGVCRTEGVKNKGQSCEFQSDTCGG